jgi:hypothetical protein
MSGFASGCLWGHDRQVHRSGVPGLRGAVVRYPGKRPPATTTGYLRCIVGDAVPVERAQGVARAWIDGLLWRRHSGVLALAWTTSLTVRLTVRWAASGRCPVRVGFDERS